MSHASESSFSPVPPDCLSGGGEMGERMRAFDWSRTPLGPVETWPQSLHTAVRIMLTSRQPIWLGWGEQLIKFYNDPYKEIVGGKHPSALGQPAAVVWRDIWNEIGPMLETAMGGVEGTYVEEQLLIMERNGYPEETYYTFSYSPVPNDDGGVGGIICANTDDTRRVIGERQLALLRELAARTADARTVEEACALSADCLATNPRDLPFAMIYLVEPNAGKVALAANPCGVTRGREVAPETAPVEKSAIWPFAQVLATNRACLVSDLSVFAGNLPMGAWDRAPHQAVAIPIAAQGRTSQAGILVVGLNPYRLYDESYRGFLDLVAAQISVNIASAQAYEEERKRVEALAELDRAKIEFFSNVSHEFRTPLTLMLGPLEDFLQQADGSLSPAEREQLEVARRNSLRLLKLVNTLLDFSRIEAGRVQATYEPTDLAAFTAELASVFRSAVEKAGLRLTVNCPTLSEPVYVDHEMWEKIVLNLLSNAFKFTFAGGIEVSLRQAGETAELSIRDTGTGIPAEELPGLFERFHRVKGARGRSYEGSGIGLALVQELVKMHGGSVRVTSEVDRGSTFIVSIPTGKAHLSADRIEVARTLASTGLRGQAYVEEALRWLPGEEALSPGFSRNDSAAQLPVVAGAPNISRILLADDNADMREYVRRLLAESGYEAVTAGDGKAALEAARERSFDLVLTDVMMPKLDGFGLLRALRADERTRATPVIMLSARAGEEARVEGMEAGADDYLVKPFSARELVARVESNLKLARLRREEEERAAADLQAMERLREVGALCARAGQDFKQCLDEIVAAAIAVTGADKGNIQLLDAKSGTLRIMAHRGFADPFLKFFACVTDKELAACGAALRSTERIIVEDVTRSEIFARQSFVDVLLEADVRAVQSTPLISSSGQVVGMISTHFRLPHRPAERDLRLMDLLAQQTADYLERRLADEALRAREAQLHTLFDAVPLGVYLVDADFRIRQVNPTALPVFGDIPDLIGRNFDEVLHILWTKEFADELVRLFRHTLQTGEPYIASERIEERLDRGVTEYYEWRIDRIPLPDGRHGVVCCFRDISAQVKARKAVEEANRMKDEFLATLSHELRNPLNSITGYADVLLQSPEAKPFPIVRQAAGTIRRNAEAQAQLINDLLDLSRLQTGKLAVDRRPIALASVVGDAIESVRAQAEAKGLKFDEDFSAESLVVNADPVRVQQIVWNLVNNAVKFTPKGGGVSVRLSNDAGEARLVVEDTGRGIETAFLPHVFEMFRQAEGGTKRSHGGMGIGLALVKQLVELHGGKVEAFSEGQGRGARFTVKLPLHTATNLERTAPHETTVEELSGARILVVDDSEDSLEMLRILLSGKGATVETAVNGEEGFKMTKDEEFDLIISDISMPVMDGYEFLKKLREARPQYANIPTIALTGFGREEDVERARQAGFTTHLTKPLDFKHLLRLAYVTLRR